MTLLSDGDWDGADKKAESGHPSQLLVPAHLQLGRQTATDVSDHVKLRLCDTFSVSIGLACNDSLGKSWLIHLEL